MALKKFEGFTNYRKDSQSPVSSVLYVEDEDTNWNVTELHLRGRYNLKRARNSQETFAILAKETFDLILLDIQLGGSEYDGIEICKILKKIPGQYLPIEAESIDCRSVPVVFVTAYSARYSKEDLLIRSGADDVITKPVDFTRLRLVTSRLIVKKATLKKAKR